ncbi:MAG: carboxypeptidase-like regulatory domain-containing protein, partial [Gammaproteobacteria bacterium]|nr:carboxypeptidase-like regulatory domain-containing protein [Gammaproteobacteria bacterium]
VLLSIRRDMTSGRPFDRYGADTGKTGYGSVEGVVFYDENRDGIRQASERAAAGAVIYLDRRYRKVTDRDGRFEFTPVPVGQHSLSVAVEDLPLPWGLDDESPRPLSVNIRESASVSIPLVRYDE